MKPLPTSDRRSANANYNSTSRPRVASGGPGEGDERARTSHRSTRSSAMGTAADLRERRTEKREVRERETEVRRTRTRSPLKPAGRSRAEKQPRDERLSKSTARQSSEQPQPQPLPQHREEVHIHEETRYRQPERAQSR